MDLNSEEIFAWARQNVEVLIAVGSAFVALVGALLATNETRKQRKLQVETLRQRIDGASLDWGNEAIDLLGEAGAVAWLCRSNVPETEIEKARHDVARKISSMVDRGRLFFPNVNPASKGAEKEGAYRGHRPPVLDAMMYAYYEVQEISRSGGPSPQDSANFIFDCRRLLVSELQAHLDPRRRDEIIGRYEDQNHARKDDALLRAGRLGLTLDARRPGLLTGLGDKGWMDMIGPEERRAVLHEVQHPEDIADEAVEDAPDEARKEA